MFIIVPTYSKHGINVYHMDEEDIKKNLRGT